MSGSTPVFARVAIVGAGLIGGSLALAARRAGAHVRLTDAQPDVRRRAAELALADEVHDDVAGTVRDAELVVAAVPAGAVADVLADASRHAPSTALLTDVASLKAGVAREVTDALEAAGGDPSRFVGGHPMAGSERNGPDAAAESLFQAATWVLTPSAVSDDLTLERLSAFLRQLGARVVVLSPERHDELVAIVSHLPQLAASALADVAADAVEATGEAVLSLAGGGFRDTTRIAASDPKLWLGILRGNRPAVLDALTAYGDRVEALRGALERGEWDRVAGVLARASEARRRLVPKALQVDAVDLAVPIADRPGALAVVATALGEAGVNVEDLLIRHDAEGRRGMLVVRVARDQQGSALAALASVGVTAHVEEAVAGRTPDDGGSV